MEQSARNRARVICKKLNLPTEDSGVAFQIISAALLKHEDDVRQSCLIAVSQIPIQSLNYSMVNKAIMGTNTAK